MKRVAAAMAASLIYLATPIRAFHLIGIHPQTFKNDEEVPMKVNSMTSIHTQIPKDYYSLPFCQPTGGPKMASENLGEFLTGSKVESSPYVINMGRDSFCKVLCQVTLSKDEARFFQAHVKRGYHNNWIIDNLPSASVGLNNENGEKQWHYAGGFPIGFVAPKPGIAASELEKAEPKIGMSPKEYYTVNKNFWKTQDAYVYNHVNLHIEYHELNGATGTEYRVVGFAVEPMSVKHQYVEENYQWNGVSSEGFAKPLKTCPSTVGAHMSRNFIAENQIIAEGEHIMYTYDVIWRQSETEWASRWDVYLTEDHMVPAQVHWYSIFNSFFVVLLLGLLVVGVLVRNLRKDIDAYNNAALVMLTDEENDEENDESGWKLIHADVFRPPMVNPMLLCVLVGSGVQLTSTTLLSIVFSASGFLSPARRGSLMISILVVYMLSGSAAGYVSSRLYKAIKGKQWQRCTVLTAMLFPGLCFCIFLFFNIILAFFHSSGSVPVLDVLLLAVMWCCVSVPLVFLGSFFGYKQDAISFPTVTSSVARVIPEVEIYMNPKVIMCAAGLVPFAAAYVELFFIMTSLWMDQFYYVFGFTFAVFLILNLTCSATTILSCYYQLCAENHRWWWFSFITSGSVGLYLFGYSFYWFKQLEASRMLMTYLLYFGYMFLISFAVFLMTGMVGFLSCFWFTRKIFGSIKVD